MNTILDQGSPQLRSDDVRACKRNVENRIYALFLAILSGMQHILLSFGRRLSSFGAAKPCTGTVQIFTSHSCILGIIQDRCLVIKICQLNYVKDFASKRLIFWKEWAELRYLRISHEAISTGNSP